jgi:hypothetical protein
MMRTGSADEAVDEADTVIGRGLNFRRMVLLLAIGIVIGLIIFRSR